MSVIAWFRQLWKCAVIQRKVLSMKIWGITRLVALTLTVFLPVIVQAKPQNWIEVRSTHFLVVKNGGEKQGLATANQLERIQAFFKQSLAVRSQHPSPFVNVLAVNNESTMREMLLHRRSGSF